MATIGVPRYVPFLDSLPEGQLGNSRILQKYCRQARQEVLPDLKVLQAIQARGILNFRERVSAWLAWKSHWVSVARQKIGPEMGDTVCYLRAHPSVVRISFILPVHDVSSDPTKPQSTLSKSPTTQSGSSWAKRARGAQKQQRARASRSLIVVNLRG